MEVYLLYEADVGNDPVIGIYDSLELAKNAAIQLNLEYYNEYPDEEYQELSFEQSKTRNDTYIVAKVLKILTKYIIIKKTVICENLVKCANDNN